MLGRTGVNAPRQKAASGGSGFRPPCTDRVHSLGSLAHCVSEPATILLLVNNRTSYADSLWRSSRDRGSPVGNQTRVGKAIGLGREGPRLLSP